MMSYVLLKTVPHHLTGNIILASSIVYLSCIHMHRQIYHTADYSLDITDNISRKEINANCNKKNKTSFDKIPSPLEFFAYTLAFQTLMCGPVVKNEKEHESEPSPRRAVLYKLAQNFRTAVASWNKNTNAWLRSVAYERGGAAWRTARVYALSALWHGFHPGYYLTFFAGGLFTIRGFARPMFLGSRPKKLFYDSLSFITTRVAMTYATVPFVLLHLSPSLAFYGRFYYSLHLIALGAMFLPTSPKCIKYQENQVPGSSKPSTDIKIVDSNAETNGKPKIS
ncbi:unnamed protein product [Leptidea sinapis]|nr:unnamed protein product [Leptidea sinapis]